MGPEGVVMVDLIRALIQKKQASYDSAVTITVCTSK
jgi:hypothetical protein